VEPGNSGRLVYDPFFIRFSGSLQKCSNESLNNLHITAIAARGCKTSNNEFVFEGNLGVQPTVNPTEDKGDGKGNGGSKLLGEHSGGLVSAWVIAMMATAFLA